MGVLELTSEQRRPKEVLIDFEEKMSLANAAAYFESISRKLKEEGSFTLNLNGKTVEIKPSSSVELEIKVEKENDKHKFEMELEWVEGQDDQTLTID